MPSQRCSDGGLVEPGIDLGDDEAGMIQHVLNGHSAGSIHGKPTGTGAPEITNLHIVASCRSANLVPVIRNGWVVS